MDDYFPIAKPVPCPIVQCPNWPKLAATPAPAPTPSPPPAALANPVPTAVGTPSGPIQPPPIPLPVAAEFPEILNKLNLIITSLIPVMEMKNGC